LGGSHGGQTYYQGGGSHGGQTYYQGGGSRGGMITGTTGDNVITSTGDQSQVIYGMGGTDHITVGNGNDTIFANNGIAGTGQGHYEAQLNIAATSPDEAHGATMSYSVNGLPDHASLVYHDQYGVTHTVDPSHITDAQLHSGVYLSFPDNHVPAQGFDLSVTANLQETDGHVMTSHASLAVDPASFMGGSDVITAGSGNNTIWGGAGNNTISVGDGNDTIHGYDGNNVITAGNGHDAITVGDGNNSISLGHGTSTIVAGDGNNSISLGAGDVTVGNGHNTITYTNMTAGGGGSQGGYALDGGGDHHSGYALGGTVTVSGGTDTINMSGDAQVNVVDHAANTATEHLTINVTDVTGHTDSMLFDFSGHTGVGAGGGDGWTQQQGADMNISQHGSATLYVSDGHHSWVVPGGGTTQPGHDGQQGGTNDPAHGTATVASDATVHVYTDASHEHEIAQFHNIDKITY
jgi:hypothetical protein